MSLQSNYYPLPVVKGTTAGTYAEGNHAHGNLSSDGKVGSVTGLPLVTTTAGAITTLALGAANTVLKVNSGGTAVEFGAAGGVVSGSTDNAILRADGTGGSTSQSSDILIDDATTSTQANIAIVNNHSETNSALVLTPKGTGGFIVGPKPDGTATGGGNARGLKAVDLSFQRTAATQVASGNYSAVLGGDRCTASGTGSVAMGVNATASGTGSIAFGTGASNATVASAGGGIAIGEFCQATSSPNPVAIGRECTSSGNGAIAIGAFSTSSGSRSIALSWSNTASGVNSCVIGGTSGVADRSNLKAHSSGQFAAAGDSQHIEIVLRAKTTTNTAVELLVNNALVTNGRLTCPSGKIISGIINIHGVKSDGTASAHFVRMFQVKNVGGVSSYPYTAAIIGTDYASSTSITFNDPDTNGDALSVSVTGIASETWRWTAHVSAVETAYGT